MYLRPSTAASIKSASQSVLRESNRLIGPLTHVASYFAGNPQIAPIVTAGLSRIVTQYNSLSTQRELGDQLNEHISRDSCSDLSGRNRVEELNNSLDVLRRVGLNVSHVPDTSLSELVRNPLPEDIDKYKCTLNELSRVVIKIPSVHPTAVAALKHLQEYLSKNTYSYCQLSIDCSSALAVDMLRDLDNGNVDYLFCANSPMFLFEEGCALEDFQMVAPIQRTWHTILAPKSEDYFSGKEVLYYQPGTSAEEQRLNREWCSSRSYRFVPLSEKDTMRDVASSLNSGERLLAIGPAGIELEATTKTQVINEPYAIRQSLYVNKRFANSLRKYHDAFVSLFILAWRDCIERENSSYTHSLLMNDSRFRSTYSNASLLASRH